MWIVYLGFYVAFNTVQVISRRIVGRAEETSAYSSSVFCTVNCRLMASNYTAFPFEAVPGIEPRPQRWEVRVSPLCHRGPHKPCGYQHIVCTAYKLRAPSVNRVHDTHNVFRDVTKKLGKQILFNIFWHSSPMGVLSPNLHNVHIQVITCEISFPQ